MGPHILGKLLLSRISKSQHYLEEAGFIVLRFTNEEVLTAIDRVYEKIEEEIEQLLTNRKKNTFHKG